MGLPTSEVGYTPAMHGREDHEVHKDMWGIGLKKKKSNILVHDTHFTNVLTMFILCSNV